MQQLKTENCIICGKKAKYWGGHVKGLYNMLLDILKEKLLPDFEKITKNMKTAMKMAVMENMIPGKAGKCIPLFDK